MLRAACHSHVLKCPNSSRHPCLLEAVIFAFEAKSIALLSSVDDTRSVCAHVSANDVSMTAFSGGAAIGQVANVFKSLDTASPFRLIQVLQMELAISESYLSMQTMCVRGLGYWFVG